MPGFGRGPPLPGWAAATGGRAVAPARAGRHVARPGWTCGRCGSLTLTKRGGAELPTPKGLLPTRGERGPGFGNRGRAATRSRRRNAAIVRPRALLGRRTLRSHPMFCRRAQAGAGASAGSVTDGRRLVKRPGAAEAPGAPLVSGAAEPWRRASRTIHPWTRHPWTRSRSGTARHGLRPAGGRQARGLAWQHYRLRGGIPLEPPVSPGHRSMHRWSGPACRQQRETSREVCGRPVPPPLRKRTSHTHRGRRVS